MKLWSNPIRVDRALRIANRVSRAEEAYIRANRLQTFGPRRRKFFHTDAPREAVYGASHEITVSLTIDHLELPPDREFVDLGSGFGGVCFVAGLYFRKAVGFELDTGIFKEAEQLKKELDFENNVSFRNEDFLKADLSGFSVIFFFEPFWKGLEHELAQKIQGLEPGAIVMPLIRPQDRDLLMPPENFRRLQAQTEKGRQFTLYEAFEKIS